MSEPIPQESPVGTRTAELQRLRDAAQAYAKSIDGLLDTLGMGPAQLHCMAWEERARKALRDAMERAEVIGLVEGCNA